MEHDERSRQKALERIKKCLALSESTNPHEAEAALRQAHKLMEKYQLEHSDIDASRAEEFVLQIGSAKRHPAPWVRMLSSTVAESLSCICFIRSGYRGQALIFIGEQGSGELAAYAYDVLSRQLQQSKKRYQDELPSCGSSYKRKMGTLYAEGWIQAVRSRVNNFAEMSERTASAINAFTQANYPDVRPIKAKRRKVTREEWLAHEAGKEEGGRVSLHRPVNQSEVLRLE